MLSRNRFQVIFVLLVSAVFWGGCASPESKCEEAKSINTIQAYEEFLSEHGKSEYAAETRIQIERLKLEEVNAANEKEYKELVESGKLDKGLVTYEALIMSVKMHVLNARH